jgi:Na+/serine symporter
VVPTPTVTVSPESAAALPETGRVVGSDFFTGFVAGLLVLVLAILFVALVVVALLVAWRIRRMRQAEEEQA